MKIRIDEILMEEKMIISERIFYVMEQKNITQLELSRRTGIATSNISDWKKKRRIPKRTVCCLYVMHWRLLTNSFCFENEYISLTDIAKYRNDNDPRFVIQNWMRNRNTVEFLAVWEELHNPDFNRVQFEAVRSEAGLNRFVMTPTKWIEQTNAIGIVSKAGR